MKVYFPSFVRGPVDENQTPIGGCNQNVVVIGCISRPHFPKHRLVHRRNQRPIKKLPSISPPQITKQKLPSISEKLTVIFVYKNRRCRKAAHSGDYRFTTPLQNSVSSAASLRPRRSISRLRTGGCRRRKHRF